MRDWIEYDETIMLTVHIPMLKFIMETMILPFLNGEDTRLKEDRHGLLARTLLILISGLKDSCLLKWRTIISMISVILAKYGSI